MPKYKKGDILISIREGYLYAIEIKKVFEKPRRDNNDYLVKCLHDPYWEGEPYKAFQRDVFLDNYSKIELGFYGNSYVYWDLGEFLKQKFYKKEQKLMKKTINEVK